MKTHALARAPAWRRALHCAGPVQAFDVDYRLFASSDPTHRGIARFADAAGTAPRGAAPAVRVPGAGPRTLERAFVIELLP